MLRDGVGRVMDDTRGARARRRRPPTDSLGSGSDLEDPIG